MNRYLTLLVLVAVACGGEAQTRGEPGTTIVPAVEEVELGRGFPITVRREAAPGETLPPFDERSLAPLAVRPLGPGRYLAHAFSPGDVVLPGGSRVRVLTVLDPAAPGAPERPEPPGTDSPLLPWLAGAGLLAGAVALVAVRRRRGRPATPAPMEPEAAAPPPPGPDQVALSRLAALRHRRPGNREKTVAFFTEGSGAVREFVAARFAVPTSVRTTEECAAALPAPAGSGLLQTLRPADFVKFARLHPGEGECQAFLDAAETWVREQGPGGTS